MALPQLNYLNNFMIVIFIHW